MPQSAAASSTTRRKHVTTACVPCRESKVKCDGVSPVCSNCKAKDKECRYQTGDDKRKLSLRVAIELLSGRIEHLCEFISAHNLQPPPMDANEQATLMKVLGHLRLVHAFTSKGLYGKASNPSPQQSPSSQTQLPDSSRSMQNGSCNQTSDSILAQPSLSVWNSSIPESSIQATQSVSGDPSNAPSNSKDLHIAVVPSPGDSVPAALNPPLWSWNPDEDLGFGLQPPFPIGEDAFRGMVANGATAENKSQESSQPQPGVQSGEDSDYAESTEALVDRLSERIGSLQIGPGGQVRYYGPTSNFNLVEMPPPDNLTVHRTVRNDGQEYLERLGIEKAVPPDLEEHLVNLYFAWQDPAFHVVNRKMFSEARTKWRDKKEDTPYFSEALQNSICSLGAAFESRYHPTFVTFPKSLADFFADRAKALLEIELDCPCVATVQAMVVLSSHDIGCKRDARGWLYSGMAMRLAFDLALHVDLSPYVTKRSLSQAEADLRRDVFWGAYTIDHLWGFYLGRPFRINMEDVTVEKPGGVPSSEVPGQWIPYISSKSLEETVPLPDYTNEIHRQRIWMVEMMAPLGYALYGSLRASPASLQEMSAKTTAGLLNWKTSLPRELQIDLDDRETPYLPHVILLHMQYYQNMIHLHRPWMSEYSQPSPPQGPGSSHARVMCVEAAFTVAKLLQIYEIHYSFRRMNIQGVGITCSAALMLIFAAVSHYKSQDGIETGLYLSVCFRALDDFSASWESAKRARDFLTLLQRQWEIQGRSARARRASPSLGDGSSPRKRTRTSSLRDRPDIRSYMGQSPRQQSGLHGQEAGGMEMAIDLDWIFTGDIYHQSQGPLGHL